MLLFYLIWFSKLSPFRLSSRKQKSIVLDQAVPIPLKKNLKKMDVIIRVSPSLSGTRFVLS